MLMKKLTALLLALLLPAACHCTAQAEETPKKLTVMVYMCGADLEPRNAQASRCIGNMVTSRYNADAINVIIIRNTNKVRTAFMSIPPQPVWCIVP